MRNQIYDLWTFARTLRNKIMPATSLPCVRSSARGQCNYGFAFVVGAFYSRCAFELIINWRWFMFHWNREIWAFDFAFGFAFDLYCVVVGEDVEKHLRYSLFVIKMARRHGYLSSENTTKALESWSKCKSIHRNGKTSKMLHVKFIHRNLPFPTIQSCNVFYFYVSMASFLVCLRSFNKREAKSLNI